MVFLCGAQVRAARSEVRAVSLQYENNMWAVVETLERHLAWGTVIRMHEELREPQGCRRVLVCRGNPQREQLSALTLR